jgi:hypothetical protein
VAKIVQGCGTSLGLYSNWTAFTPTGSLSGANVVYSGFVRQVGDTLECSVEIRFNGLPDAGANLSVDPPSGFVIDTAKLAVNGQAIGGGVGDDSGAARGPFFCQYNTSTSQIDVWVCTGSPNTAGRVSNTVPVTWNTGDFIMLYFWLPTSSGTSTTNPVRGYGTNLTTYTGWTDFTPTSNFTNTTHVGKVRQVGDTIDVQILITCTGTPAAATLAIDPPAGYTIDTSKLPSGGNPILSTSVTILDALPTPLGRAQSIVRYNVSTGKIFIQIRTTAPSTMSSVSNTVPQPFAVGDNFRICFSLPVSAYPASSVVAGGPAQLQYNPWTSYSTTGLWRRVGDQTYVQTYVTCSAAPTPAGAVLQATPPSEMTLDSNKFLQANVGTSYALDVSASSTRGPGISGCTATVMSPVTICFTAPNLNGTPSTSNPFAAANGDVWSGFFSIPSY